MQLVIKIVPQSAQNKIVGYYQNMLKIQLKGVPEKGKLNELLIEFLAETLEIPQSAMVIKQGLTNPVKRLEIDQAYALKTDIYLSRYKI